MTPTMRTLLVLALTAVVTLPLVPFATPIRASRPPRFAWPLAPPHRVVRAFEPPATEYAAGHRGVDLAAPPGTAVLAAGDAVVLHAGPVADRAVVSLLHAGGLRTTYEPIAPAVRRGQHVRRGTLIGTLHPGHESCPAEACLHWGALRTAPPDHRTYLDPLRLLANGRSRLLPRRDRPDPTADPTARFTSRPHTPTKPASPHPLPATPRPRPTGSPAPHGPATPPAPSPPPPSAGPHRADP
ncbi:M23 family metallopeptidase [Actinosynnema sp. NPDC051121]